MRSTGWIAIALFAQGALAASDGPSGHVDVGTGYRQDYLKMSAKEVIGHKFGVPITSPSILRLKHLSIYEIMAQYETDHCSPIFLNLSGRLGWVTEGVEKSITPTRFVTKTGTSSHARRKKSNLLAISNANRVRGGTKDLSGKVGYRFLFGNNQFSFSPLVGFSYDQLHAFVRHPTESLPGARISKNFIRVPQPVHINIQSRGALAGFEADYVADPSWRFYGGFSWNWDRTESSLLFEEQFASPHRRRGSINKNHKPMFVDFTSKMTSRMHPQGPEAHGGFFYNYCDWEIGLRGTYSRLYTNHGQEKIKLSLKTSRLRQAVSPSPVPLPGVIAVLNDYNTATINRFHWDNWSVQLLLGYKF